MGREKEIVINNKFKSLIPALSPDEYEGLEQSILSEGCRDALVLWNDTLIDGHNRYEICTKHNLPYKTMQKEFASEEDAVIWIIDNQLSRRNIDKWQKFDLNKAREEIVSKQAKERQATYHGNQYEKGGLVENLPEVQNARTRDIMGASIGVSGKTYDKMKVIDEQASPEIKKLVRAGQMTTNDAYLQTKGIKDKSPAKAKREFYETVNDEREEFKNKKEVTIEDIQKDKTNRGILARKLYSQILQMGAKITEVSLIEKDVNISVEEMAKALDDGEISSLKKSIQWWIGALTSIERRL